MTWHNLPCPPTLAAIAAACPRGWIELDVTHYSGNSGVGGGDPQEPDTTIHEGRLWGVDKTDIDDVEKIMRELWMDGDLYELARGMRSNGVLLARVEQAPLVCNTCGGPCDAETMTCRKTPKDDAEPRAGDCWGLAILALCLVTTWGEGGKPVCWTGEGPPDYTGQQAPPKPGHGDMWARVIEWAQGRCSAGLIERMKERRQLGLDRYGTVLQAHNGRDVGRDLLEETLDQMAYLEQLADERPETRLVVHDAKLAALRLARYLVNDQPWTLHRS
jgi:hypothetical protein